MNSCMSETPMSSSNTFLMCQNSLNLKKVAFLPRLSAFFFFFKANNEFLRAQLGIVNVEK